MYDGGITAAFSLHRARIPQNYPQSSGKTRLPGRTQPGQDVRPDAIGKVNYCGFAGVAGVGLLAGLWVVAAGLWVVAAGLGVVAAGLGSVVPLGLLLEAGAEAGAATPDWEL